MDFLVGGIFFHYSVTSTWDFTGKKRQFLDRYQSILEGEREREVGGCVFDIKGRFKRQTD